MVGGQQFHQREPVKPPPCPQQLADLYPHLAQLLAASTWSACALAADLYAGVDVHQPAMEASQGQETDGGMGREEAWVERRHG